MKIKTLMAVAQNQIEWVYTERLALGANEVRIRNRFGTEKHGTMTAIVQGYGDHRGQMNEELGLYFGTGVAWQYPISLGNMNYGNVIETGSDVQNIPVGSQVAVSGSFQLETVARTEDCFPCPEGLDWRTAFLQDPAEFAMGAIRDGNVRIGDQVAVFSLGSIGLTTIQLLKAAGAERVVGIDPIAARREAALACGADSVLGADPEDLGWQIRQLTRREGIDVVIDFSGAVPAMQAAFRALAPLGTLVLGAYPNEKTATLDFGRESHHNQITIVFTRACSHPNRDHPRWDWHRIRRASWDLIVRGKLDGRPILDDPIPFDDLLDHYPRGLDPQSTSIKLTVAYPE